MDAVFVYRDQRFLWNVSKARGNLLKHGVTFEKACEVFFDPFLCITDATLWDLSLYGANKVRSWQGDTPTPYYRLFGTYILRSRQ